MLEQLYRQIGSLHQLTYLKLKAITKDQQAGMAVMGKYFTNTFPVLLTLGDADGSGRPGFLDCLARLTKPKEIQGSVHAIAMETVVTMGLAEVHSIATHWPRLELAEFFHKNEVLTNPFAWLQDQYKDQLLALKRPFIDYFST